jgi:hypothetical protein
MRAAGRRVSCVTWMRMFVLGSLIVLTLPAQAAPPGEAAPITIRLISLETYSKVLTDRAPTNEASEGDVLVVGSTLRNAVAQFGRSKGAAVGEDTAVFTIRSRTRADVIVESTLPGGWLRAAGRVRLGPKQTYPVTGGRGRFANARGTGEAVALVHQGQGNRRLKVYRLALR